MSVLDDLAVEVGISSDELRARLTTPGADTIAPNYLTQDAKGRIGANFAGHIEAAGLDLTADYGADIAAASGMARWLRPADGVTAARIYDALSVPNDSVLYVQASGDDGFSTVAGLQAEAKGDGTLAAVYAEAFTAAGASATRKILDNNGNADYVQVGDGRTALHVGIFAWNNYACPAVGAGPNYAWAPANFAPDLGGATPLYADCQITGYAAFQDKMGCDTFGANRFRAIFSNDGAAIAARTANFLALVIW